jgi:hypothetical protein
MVSLADVKAHLSITTVDTARDTKLQLKIDAAEAFVSEVLGGTGALAAQAVTQRVNGFTSTLVLTSLPIVSVTSVTGSDGVLVPLSGLDVDLAAGIIRSNATYYYAAPYYPFLLPYYTVVYQSGYSTLPADLVEAVKLMSQYFWETQRGNRPGPGGGGDTTGPGDAYARAQQILSNRPTPGFA